VGILKVRSALLLSMLVSNQLISPTSGDQGTPVLNIQDLSVLNELKFPIN